MKHSEFLTFRTSLDPYDPGRMRDLYGLKGVIMADFMMSAITLLGGVFGSVIGFVILALSATVLIVPYILLYRRSSRSRDRRPLTDRQY